MLRHCSEGSDASWERSGSVDSAGVVGGCGTGGGLAQSPHSGPSRFPLPDSEAAEPRAEEGHEGGEQTQSLAAICGAGEELSLGCA